jgi:cob(I)alamin adenosyltransferase
MGMRIYTKTGDAGETGLFGGPRVRKDHARIEAFGTVDELNSQLGLVRAALVASAVGERCDPLLRRFQCDLFELGAQLASPASTAERITSGHVVAIERAIDEFESGLPPLDCFVLPAGNAASAAVHVARTVCRRAERRVVGLSPSAGREALTESAAFPEAEGSDEAVCASTAAAAAQIPANAIEYLNRLGDFLFVLARWVNAACEDRDDPWHPAEVGP